MANYTLGRGELYFDRFLTGTTTKSGERYLGNSTEFNINIASQMLDHFNSDQGIRVKDDSVVLELTRTGSFILDDISADNLSLLLLGTSGSVAQTAVVVTDAVLAPVGSVQKDRYYQIGATTLNPSGIRNATAITVKKGTTVGTATAATLGTDYTVDAALGRVYIPTGSSVAPATEGLWVTYTPVVNSRVQVVTSSNATIEGALRFIAKNPKGTDRDYYMPYAKLSPNGDFSLKGDSWQQLPFNVEILLLDASTQAIYVDGRAA
jgi:hypothetical protein